MYEKITKTTEIAGRKVTLETGYLASQAHGAVIASSGETQVMSTVVGADPREGLDFFPLSVDYEERLYAGGIIKGSRWTKREGRPTDQAILNGRMIDRSIRPLFPKGFKNDVQVVITVLSVDEENDPVILATLATSAAFRIAGLPWEGPIAAARVGIVDGQMVINPGVDQMESSDMDLFISGTKDQILMVEMGGNEVPYKKILDGIYQAHEAIQPAFTLIEDLTRETQEKFGVKFEMKEVEETEDEVKEKETLARIHDYITENFPEVLLNTNHANRKQVENEFLEQLFTEFEGKVSKGKITDEFNSVTKKLLRKKVIETKTRVDGRSVDEVRPISIEIAPLARTHGSAVFTRGETQALTITTLGSTSLEQLIESVYGESKKRYIHHYNFPPYSVGETGRVGSPKRREIGHGALAERALEPVIPGEDVFPYTIRVVSEVLSSNGSTSMASTCGSTLSLMDAGVPIKSPVSGIAMGLIKEGDEHVVLSDIMGIEDYYGDMDFKVAGTKDGVTALQMDVKVHGLTKEILETALAQAETGRAHILNEMLKAIEQPREQLSTYAPKIKSVKIDPKKIGDIIGPGGKIIRAMQEETETEIDVQEDGWVHVAGVNLEGLESAVSQIEMLTKEVEVGEIYEGKVVRLMDFGAFVELIPGKDGLVHVSELAPGFVKNVTDVVKEGDVVKVKVIGIDDQGRVNLSRKVLMGEERSEDGGSNQSGNNGNKTPDDDKTERGNGNQDQGSGENRGGGSRSKVYKMDRSGGKRKPRPDNKRHGKN